jgi:ABC-2 type transport system permease protein
MDPNTVAQLLTPVPVESVSIGAVSGRSGDDAAAAALMTVALLAAIIIYGNLVLTGVVEEKSSRVVEVLLARLPAKALLGGKVVGIGLLGFGQLAVTALAALLASMFVDSADLPAVSAGVLAWVLVWFVLGYALYAMIYGALGSLASRTEDAQAVAGPVGYVLVAGYWLSFMALSADPDGMWARVLSLFPATAPLAMPGRIALGATAWWESPLAVILTLAAITGLVSFAGRVYQNAVLRTGAVIRLRDAWHKHSHKPQQPHTPPIQKVTIMLTSPKKTLMWPLLLSTAGVLAAVLIFTLTSDAIASLIALLITFVAVRALVQHQQRGHETPRAPRSG